MEKQKASNWKIAVSYFVPSLIVGWIVSVVWGYGQIFFGANMDSNVFGMMVAAAIGAIFGARRINKKYIIANVKKIVELAGLCYVINMIVLGLAIEFTGIKIDALNLIFLPSEANTLGYFFVALVIYQSAGFWYIKSESEV